MKIAYLIEDFSMKGGAERILARKANILHDDYGHDTAIISVYRDDRPPAYPLSRGVRLVRLGVPFAAAHMVALAYYPAVAAYDHSPHHGVRFRVLPAVAGQLQAAAHIHFVGFSLFHIAKIVQTGSNAKQIRDLFCIAFMWLHGSVAVPSDLQSDGSYYKDFQSAWLYLVSYQQGVIGLIGLQILIEPEFGIRNIPYKVSLLYCI